ncbi:fibrinogen alpha-1 chain-like isoform X3 [Ruditapes philippinarum]|uniref:fibrinogen alpha-1 chain-like isoform X3 n=1 Tax=Ruditapes philippinarum TaxID=129788 RepID=UPI00295AA75C|nr:fibrinogen alpha-1 chain-like isoform X3 [Ruditapes philippinarum]
MDKYSLLFLFYYVTSVDSLPFNENDIKLKTLIAESTCNFPPMFLAKDEVYALQFRACSADWSNDVLKQMCFELEKESMCYLTPKSASSQGPVVLPTSNITKSLFSGKDKQDYVTKLCQYMTTLPWKSDECSKECSGEAFFICDLYVAMDKVLRSFFEQEAQDYTHLDVFVHSRELGFLYPYPPIGALHNNDLLMDCATPSQDTGLIQLCKVMAEVAVKFVKNRVKATFHARQVTENVTANWDPCSRMSTFAAFSTSQEFTQLQLDCPQLCNTHLAICKLIYLGIETYQNLAGGRVNSLANELPIIGDAVNNPSSLDNKFNPESQSKPEIKTTDAGNVGGNQNANGITRGQPQVGTERQPQGGTGKQPQGGTREQPQVGTGGQPQGGTGEQTLGGTGGQPQGGTGGQPQGGTEEQPQVGTGGKPQGGTGEQTLGGTGGQPQGGTGEQTLGGTGGQPQGGTGEQQQGGTGEQPLGGTGRQPQGGTGEQPQGDTVGQPQVGTEGQPQGGNGGQPQGGTGGQTLGGIGEQPQGGTGGQPQGGTGEQPQSDTGEQPQVGTAEQTLGGTGGQPQGGTGGQPQGGTGGQPQGGTGEQTQSYTGGQPQGGTGEQPQSDTGEQPQVGTGEQTLGGTGGQPQSGTGEQQQGGTGEQPLGGSDLSAGLSVIKTTYAPTTSSTDESYFYDEEEVVSMGQAVYDDESSGGHFMAYFLVFIVLSIAGYIVFYNKQKFKGRSRHDYKDIIFSIIIEGKSGKGGRRPNTKDYKQLKTDDVMPSLEKSAYSKDCVF